MPSGQEAKALVTFEVRRSEILPPKDTDGFVIPDSKKLPREIRPYLTPSPLIECRDPKIRALAKEIGADKTKAWDRVEAIYDWVREHIKDKDQGGVPKGALAALKDGNGDCEARTSVFIAICRAADIPARTVWVFGHVYPEFYLCDGKGEGHWFPCQSRGARAIRRDHGNAGDFPEGRQRPAAAERRQGAPASAARVVHRRALARRRQAAGAVRPRGGDEVRGWRDWGLGIWRVRTSTDVVLVPNPQSPIPNPALPRGLLQSSVERPKLRIPSSCRRQS